MMYFTYDPDLRRAWFSENLPEAATEIVTRVAGTVVICLVECNTLTYPVIPILRSPDGTPLLKSNLQKAIRRRETEVAIQTAILLLQRDPTEMLRRLPIIAVEDVGLIDSFPVMVWLMMAGAAYRLTTHDIDTLLHIVWSLSESPTAIDYEKCKKPPVLTDDMNDVLRAVYYRWKYGGMKGDLELLTGVIRHHSWGDRGKGGDPAQTIVTSFQKINYDHIELDPILLVEAIDFHPFPGMLRRLSRETGLSADIIKEWLWNVDSGLNIRKPDTMKRAERYRNTSEWVAIEPYLEETRASFLE